MQRPAPETDHVLMITVLGLIPARGGSKSLPGKNLALLGGKPLLAYTCEAARAARRLTRTIISTDSQEIAACAVRYGVEAPFLRPAELARDETPMLEVIRHALQHLQPVPDAVVLLQPTSPLRRAADIDAAVALLEQQGADSVVSVTEVPHQFTPSSLLRLEDGLLQPYANGATPARRQDKPVLYARNGPAVLAVRADVVLKHGSLYGARSLPLVMPREASVDIDTLEDLQWAERLVSHG